MYQMLDPATLTVLITGATAGIGAASARRFALAGARVIGTGRRADRLIAMRDELGPNFHPLEVDVRDNDAVIAALAGLPEALAKPNVVFANAGLALGLEPAQRASLDDWEDMVDTNIKGLLYTVHATLPGMVERGEGHVVFTGSIAGDYAYPGGNAYGATKAFVKQFSLNLLADLIGTQVRVTNVEPGMVETEFSLVRFHGDKTKSGNVYAGIQPLTAEDIAEQVFFCCTLPRHVAINRIQVFPTCQSFAGMKVQRGEA
ncbi:SDR family NAD(P)-dependent oxidoreductase [Ancylobacter pratisalsi]|uniref:SDR family NAD(P)-dependent oxidoreductase n=1 Tax=Ancylobacter pratisalsi TaxID=1745854 RepID=A0A6P1YJY1_9HYPH|nr:SDR family NAD(P)-dependent oxidoreductase [Ancylobacter pratisalsi]QIB33001.1 SDR family NAD(P)-dependent oxidoreductase [Ancylobacter pratisalsi]